ncbi:MAG: N-acetyl-gamma-glutamyl-phosphate reductase [Gammaproteobacteria bacterium]|nr:MAG: N-acetyl-gamma-glutamyl-phosphate reductase [Gammaproteobacteria bacterium]
MIKVGIVGGTGYTGVELLRLLAQHPQADVVSVTSRSEEGIPVSDVYPSLRGSVDCKFVTPEIENLQCCDVVFFATPNGVAMKGAAQLLEQGIKVVDLSADFRIKDVQLWSQWYGMEHASPALVERAVYGLPELNRDQIKSADLVACAGCYPTAVQLGFIPLLSNQCINPQQLIADVKSGVSGAGRQANIGIIFSEANEDFKAYGVGGHRHLPEITQGLNGYSNEPVNLTFVPHLTPMVRGIHATLYSQTITDKNIDEAQLQRVFSEYYQDEPFVDVMPLGSTPRTKSVKGSNMCRIAVYKPQAGATIVVLSVIDNLVKGAAGQAVQNMNLMCGIEETTGLEQIALMP